MAAAERVREAQERLREAFLGGWPLDELWSLTQALPSWPSEDAQAQLVDGVLDCPRARSFPPNRRRTARFLKAVSRALEEDGSVEVDERLLQMYALLPGTPSGGEPELAYVHYALGDGGPPVVLRAADAWGAGAETGCCVWDAGAWLASFALARLELFASRSVVELGTGCGLLSCLLASRCEPRALVATDVYRPTLDNLRHNLQCNGLADAPVLPAGEVPSYLAGRRREGKPAVCCASLDWLEPSLAGASALAELEPDIIVAADCVYSEELVDGLARTLRALLARPTAVALVASKRRNARTWSAFEAALERHGLRSEEDAISAGTERGGCAGRAQRRWRLSDPSDITLLRLCRG